MEKKLPDNFYWGGSVSSFQTEGARNEGGKGVCIYDVRPTDPEFSDWSVGIDEYHRYCFNERYGIQFLPFFNLLVKNYS